MSTAQRRQPVAVIARLLEEPHRFGFFQALRLLERWMRRQEGLSSAQVLGQRIAMRNSLSLAFPASEIAQFDVLRHPPAEGVASAELSAELGVKPSTELRADVPQSRSVARIEITSAVMGLLGAGGVLPVYYTELLADRELFHRDRAARAFLDIFLHRASVLFYQAFTKHRLPLQYEADRHNRYLPLVLSLAGLGQRGVRDRLRAREGGVADDALAFYAGALHSRPMSAAVLQRVLQQYFGVAVKLDQFVGRWFTLPRANQSHLGLANMQLGRDAVMGERVWQRDLRLRLTLGPMPRERFTRFLPGGPGATALRELLALMTGATLEVEIKLLLRAADVQGTCLDASNPARLGWSSFLVTQAVQQDRSDVAYDLLALA